MTLMRSFILIFTVIAVSFTALPFYSFAEKSENYEDLEAAWILEFARADLRKKRVEIIEQNMNFSPGQAAAFWPIYKKYEDEFKKLGDRRIALIKDYERQFDNMTEMVAMDLSKRAIQLRKDRLSLWEKYYNKIEKEVDAVTATRFLQIENFINLLVDIQISSEIPLIKH